MSLTQIIDILRFSVPMLTAIVCILLIVRGYGLQSEPLRKKLTVLLVLTKSCSALAWFCLLCYTFAPEFFVCIHSLFLLVLLWNHIFFIHFVFVLTGTGNNRKFPVVHYIIPAVLSVAMVVWSAFVPIEAQMHIVTHSGAPAERYRWYSMFFVSKMPINLLYTVAYGIWAFVQLWRYRREVVNYSADNEGTSMRWLYIFIAVSLCTLVITVPSVFVPRDSLLGSGLLLLPVVVIMFQGVIIAYNMIVGNYVVIYGDSKNPPARIANRTELQKRLEQYLQQHKPYLNPKLRITDLTAPLYTNRTTLSALINKTYGMNFINWINSHRLREFEAISANPVFAECQMDEIAEMSGFGSFEAYKRIAKTK